MSPTPRQTERDPIVMAADAGKAACIQRLRRAIDATKRLSAMPLSAEECLTILEHMTWDEESIPERPMPEPTRGCICGGDSALPGECRAAPVSYSSCRLLCSVEMACPLCGVHVPANTEHTCSSGYAAEHVGRAIARALEG